MRTAMLGLLLGLIGCQSSTESAGPAKAEEPAPPGDAKSPAHDRRPAHDFDTKPGPPNLRTTRGTINVTIDGTPTTFGFLPYGANSVTAGGDRGRTTINGQLSADRHPRIQLYLSGIRPDEMALPAVLDTGSAKGRDVQIRLWRSPEIAYESEPGAARIQIDSFDGKQLTGTFEGVLASRASGAPARLSEGRFTVRVRTRGLDDAAGAPASAPTPR